MRMCSLIPLLIFIALVIFLWKGLAKDPHQLPSTFINKPILQFSYPSLMHPQQPITQQQLLGHIFLLNVWATWCVTCYTEHPLLMEIARSQQVVVYGLNYKDDQTAALAWLKKYGNPYRDIIVDEKGKLAIELGVYGTPETFLIDRHGIVRYKHIGALNTKIWQEKIAPLVKKLSEEK